MWGLLAAAGDLGCALLGGSGRRPEPVLGSGDISRSPSWAGGEFLLSLGDFGSWGTPEDSPCCCHYLGRLGRAHVVTAVSARCWDSSPSRDPFQPYHPLTLCRSLAMLTIYPLSASLFLPKPLPSGWEAAGGCQVLWSQPCTRTDPSTLGRPVLGHPHPHGVFGMAAPHTDPIPTTSPSPRLSSACSF